MGVCIFWDNSNIFIPARYLANKREGWSAGRDVRIHFDNMFSLARAGREIESAFCVGSVPPELEAVWARLERVGVQVELFERSEEHTSELQSRLHLVCRLLLEKKKKAEKQQTGRT